MGVPCEAAAAVLALRAGDAACAGSCTRASLACSSRFGGAALMLLAAAGRFCGSADVGGAAAVEEVGSGALDVEGCGWCENGQWNTRQVLQSGHSPNSLQDGNILTGLQLSERESHFVFDHNPHSHWLGPGCLCYILQIPKKLPPLPSSMHMRPSRRRRRRRAPPPNRRQLPPSA